MTEIEKYAVSLVGTGALSYAEDDMDEEHELDNRDDLRLAIRFTINMATAIRDNPESFRLWLAQVNA